MSNTVIGINRKNFLHPVTTILIHKCFLPRVDAGREDEVHNQRRVLPCASVNTFHSCPSKQVSVTAVQLENIKYKLSAKPELSCSARSLSSATQSSNGRHCSLVPTTTLTSKKNQGKEFIIKGLERHIQALFNYRNCQFQIPCLRRRRPGPPFLQMVFEEGNITYLWGRPRLTEISGVPCAVVAAAAWAGLLQRFCPALHRSRCRWGAAWGAAMVMTVSTLIVAVVARRCRIELQFLHLQSVCPSLHPLWCWWGRGRAQAAAAHVTVEVVVLVRAAGGGVGVAGGSVITAGGLHSAEASHEGIHLL